MLSKATLKIARELLDRFFRDAEGQTNRQLDVYFTIEDLALGQERAAPAVEFLLNRGLIQQYGADVAYLTDKGVTAAVEETDLATLPKELRDFEQAPSRSSPDAQQDPRSMSPAATPVASSYASGPRTSRTSRTSQTGQPINAEPPRASGASPRPERATLTHIALDGEEFAVELGWVCSVGRADGNDIQINDKRASKSHAEIRFEAGQFVLRDLESANGTLLNGEYVVKPVVLKHDDEVVIGRTMLLYTAPVKVHAPPEPATVEPTAARTPAPSYRVIQGTPDPARPPTGSGFASPAGSYAIGAATGDLDAPVSSLAATERPSRHSDRPVPYDGPIVPADPDGGSADLFAEPPRAGAPDLFDGSRGPSGASAPGDDLFTPSSEGADAALFGEGPTRNIFEQPLPAAAPADQDLFPTPTDSVRPHASQALAGPHSGVQVGGSAQSDRPELVVTPLAEGLQASLQDSLEELDPMAHAGASAPLLENQPVIRPDGMVEPMPEGATLTRPQTDDVATLMVSREALFGRDGSRAEPGDPPRWGDTADMHPAFGAEPVPLGTPQSEPIHRLQAFAEDLPVAALDMASWQPPMAPPSSISAREAGPAGPAAFFDTLQTLRQRLHHVDVPEKGALLEAIEVLSQHPFVRAVVESSD